ncbi:thiamine-phosphate pyrophosphorylase [Prauserella marina]|uniref:Thiamine-phosphate synthase n=2 Tax=Prauserella marina TaxID=530584 RepID=A0A1G6Q9K9_9PSEU|nr:thiamine-phosphate pyrophosphorylase [Prauserella marina]SDC88345.1 thiamine-phosphate pyrophosphorylase [Prauserella marina]
MIRIRFHGRSGSSLSARRQGSRADAPHGTGTYYGDAMPGLSGDQIRKRLSNARLYLCTDARRSRGDLAEFADAALRGGVDIIQLRDKSGGEPLEAKEEIAALEVLAAACEKHGALLSVNDRSDIAYAVGADVLHLGQDDLPVPVARELLGDGPVIGRSTHSLDQALAAAKEEGVDYFCVGPCWPTPTKPGRSAPGLELVRAVGTEVPTALPWFAIGGIDLDRLPQVREASASRVVVVRAITEASDPAEAASALRSALTAPRSV